MKLIVTSASTPFRSPGYARGADPALGAGAGLSLRIAARRRKSLVFLGADEVWAFEADARLTFVHSAYGKLDIDVSLAEIEGSPLGATFTRVHRSWLVHLGSVRALEHDPGATQLFVGEKLGTGIHVPVSRDRARVVREALMASAIGLRRRECPEAPDVAG